MKVDGVISITFCFVFCPITYFRSTIFTNQISLNYILQIFVVFSVTRLSYYRQTLGKYFVVTKAERDLRGLTIRYETC